MYAVCNWEECQVKPESWDCAKQYKRTSVPLFVIELISFVATGSEEFLRFSLSRQWKQLVEGISEYLSVLMKISLFTNYVKKNNLNRLILPLTILAAIWKSQRIFFNLSSPLDSYKILLLFVPALLVKNTMQIKNQQSAIIQIYKQSVFTDINGDS